MKNDNVIRGLKNQSTWKLIILGVVTFGIYFGHYVKKQTKRLNSYLTEETEIGDGLVTAFMVLLYLNLCFAIIDVSLELMVEEMGRKFQTAEEMAAAMQYLSFHFVSESIRSCTNIVGIIWSFKVRNRINSLCGLEKGDKNRFNGFWAFIFQMIYINFKINALNEKLDRGEA